MKNLTQTQVQEFKEIINSKNGYDAIINFEMEQENAVFNESGEYLGERRWKLEMANVIRVGDTWISLQKINDNECKLVIMERKN